jgi:hypothetical protein
MNWLLPDYFPKGSDLSDPTGADLARIAAEVNNRPRKTLAWRRPGDLFHTALTAAQPHAQTATREVGGLPAEVCAGRLSTLAAAHSNNIWEGSNSVCRSLRYWRPPAGR